MLDNPARSLRPKVVKLVVQLLESPPPGLAVATDASLASVGLSSIDMINLMLALEAEFDITFEQGDITPENFYSIATIEALLGQLFAKRASA